VYYALDRRVSEACKAFNRKFDREFDKKFDIKFDREFDIEFDRIDCKILP